MGMSRTLERRSHSHRGAERPALLERRHQTTVHVSGLVAAALLSGLVVETATTSAARNFTALGHGNNSCGEWLAGIPSSHLVMQSWVLGFVSAYNVYGPDSSGNLTAGTDSNGLFAWVDNYCQTHPLDSLAQAADQLVITLRLRRSR
jgi:hypothetical protein